MRNQILCVHSVTLRSAVLEQGGSPAQTSCNRKGSHIDDLAGLCGYLKRSRGERLLLDLASMDVGTIVLASTLVSKWSS